MPSPIRTHSTKTLILFAASAKSVPFVFGACFNIIVDIKSLRLPPIISLRPGPKECILPLGIQIVECGPIFGTRCQLVEFRLHRLGPRSLLVPPWLDRVASVICGAFFDISDDFDVEAYLVLKAPDEAAPRTRRVGTINENQVRKI